MENDFFLGPTENVSCLNEYEHTHITSKSWLNPTPNIKHALYNPVQVIYRFGHKLTFRCSVGLSLYRTKFLSVMTTTCKEDGDWTQEWPMCKGRKCMGTN